MALSQETIKKSNQIFSEPRSRIGIAFHLTPSKHVMSSSILSNFWSPELSLDEPIKEFYMIETLPQTLESFDVHDDELESYYISNEGERRDLFVFICVFVYTAHQALSNELFLTPSCSSVL
jgi:hypothetical protein